MTIDPRVLADLAIKVAGDKKAYDIKVLDISKISVIADFFILCSGRSSVNVQAIAGGIIDKIKDDFNGLSPRKEGVREGRWILLDYGDVVIHVFQEEERQYYNLERLWSDADEVGMSANL